MTSQQFCTFVLDGHLFGVPVPAVQEVLPFLPISAVPLAPTAVEGMINLRGRIVVAIDLRRRLELGKRSQSESPMNVVVQTIHGEVSLLVDDIGDVLEVDPSSFEVPPETLCGSIRPMILGVHKRETGLLHILDTEEVCRVWNPSQADPDS